jgi:hypothetical protein
VVGRGGFGLGLGGNAVIGRSHSLRRGGGKGAWTGPGRAYIRVLHSPSSSPGFLSERKRLTGGREKRQSQNPKKKGPKELSRFSYAVPGLVT